MLIYLSDSIRKEPDMPPLNKLNNENSIEREYFILEFQNRKKENKTNRKIN